MRLNYLSDFLVRFKNKRNWDTPLRVLNSKFIVKLLETLKTTKLIDYRIESNTFKYLTIRVLRNSIRSIELVSKPSRPVYKRCHELLNDAKLKKRGSFYILSNSEWGLINSTEALERGVGGHIILLVS